MHCSILFCWQVCSVFEWDLADDKSILILVFARCHQATSHYLCQSWPRFMLPFDATRHKELNKMYIIVSKAWLSVVTFYVTRCVQVLSTTYWYAYSHNILWKYWYMCLVYAHNLGQQLLRYHYHLPSITNSEACCNPLVMQCTGCECSTQVIINYELIQIQVMALFHYNDFIMGTMASQITTPTFWIQELF